MENISLTTDQVNAIELKRKAALEKRKVQLGNVPVNTVKEFSTPQKSQRNSSLVGRGIEHWTLTPAQANKIEINKLEALERRKQIKEQLEDEEMLKIAALYQKNHSSSILQFNSNSLPSSQDQDSFNMSQQHINGTTQMSTEQLRKIELNRVTALETRKRKKEQEEDEEMSKITASYEKIYASSILQFNSNSLPLSQDQDSFNTSQHREEIRSSANHQMPLEQLRKIEMNRLTALKRRKRKREQEEEQEMMKIGGMYDNSSPTSNSYLQREKVLPSSQPISGLQFLNDSEYPLIPDQIEQIEMNKNAALQRRKKKKEQHFQEISQIVPFYDCISPSSTQPNVELFPSSQQEVCINTHLFPETVVQPYSLSSLSADQLQRNEQTHPTVLEQNVENEDEESDLAEFHDCREDPEIWYL
jgi:hypothetical protein